MPLVRLISHGECDELTLFSDEAVTVTVTAQAGTTATAESYRTATGGLHVFRLDTRDFPETETLAVDAGACGSVAYTVIPAFSGARRLAWAQQRGRDRTLHLSDRKVGVRRNNQATGIRSRRASGRPNPYRKADGTRVGLRTPGGPRRAFRSPLLADVWLAGDDGYTAVDVVTEKSVLHRHGAVTCLEIEIRPKRKTGMPWN